MNEILKYWPINFTYDGEAMSVPMGEITAIEQRSEGCVIHVRGDSNGGDSWTTGMGYNDVMRQWVQAVGKFGGATPSVGGAIL